jgi:hypothetical protein
VTDSHARKLCSPSPAMIASSVVRHEPQSLKAVTDGVRTRGLEIKAGAAKLKADRAARIEADLVNRPLESAQTTRHAGSPTIRVAVIARTRGCTSFAPVAGRSTICARSTAIKPVAVLAPV